MAVSQNATVRQQNATLVEQSNGLSATKLLSKNPRKPPPNAGGDTSGSCEAVLVWCLLPLNIGFKRLDSGAACTTGEIRPRPQRGAFA